MRDDARQRDRRSRRPASARPTGGKCAPEIAQSGGAEQRVAERVQQHVGVAVPVETAFEWDLLAAEQQLPPGDEAVDVVALADAELHRIRSSGRLEAAPRTSARSAGVVTLGFGCRASTASDSHAGKPLDERRLVGADEARPSAAASMARSSSCAAEDLRRLGAKEPAAVDGSPRSPPVRAASGCRTRPARAPRRPPPRPPRRRRRRSAGRERRPRAVVDQRPDRRPRAGEAASAGATEACRRRTAGDDAHSARSREPVRRRRRDVRRQRHDHRVDAGRRAGARPSRRGAAGRRSIAELLR